MHEGRAAYRNLHSDENFRLQCESMAATAKQYLRIPHAVLTACTGLKIERVPARVAGQ